MNDTDAQLAAQAAEIKELREKVDALTALVTELVSVFNQAKGVLYFVKFIAAFATVTCAIVSILTALSHFLHPMK